MDPIEGIRQGLIEREYATYVSIFVIITVIIAVLSFIIISQNKRINELQKPRYGFLGKPIAVVLAVGLLVGSYGIIFYANRSGTQVGEISADVDLGAEIKYQYLGGESYLFNVVPQINKKDWGSNPENQFDAYWMFTSNQVESEVELELSQNKGGGITIDLDPGKYKVKVTIFHDSQEYVREIDVTLPPSS